MLILRQDNNTEDISIQDLVKLDTKVNILEAFNLAELKIAKKTSKEILANSWAQLVSNEPAYFMNRLPNEEKQMLTRLAVMKQEEHITCPKIPGQFLMMQKMYFVVSFEGRDYWHVYMPDSVRKIIMDMVNRDLIQYPGMRRLHETIDRLTVLNERLSSLLEESDVPCAERGILASSLKKDYEDRLSELKDLEKTFDSHNYPLNKVYSGVEEQIKLCDILVFSSSDPDKAKDMTVFDSMAMAMVAHKQQEMDDAAKNAGEPLAFSAAITTMPPQRMDDWQVFSQKIIRPTVIEAVLRLTKVNFMVFYVFLQNGFVHIALCWDDILDFVWNGVEQPSYWNPHFEIKKHFRKKYPRISTLFGQKELEDGSTVSEPYIMTIGFDKQPKKWWLSMKLYGMTADDFTHWALYDIISDNSGTDALNSLRDACLDIFNEINDSDAKTPKEKMRAFFGVVSIPNDELIYGIPAVTPSEPGSGTEL